MPRREKAGWGQIKSQFTVREQPQNNGNSKGETCGQTSGISSMTSKGPHLRQSHMSSILRAKSFSSVNWAYSVVHTTSLICPFYTARSFNSGFSKKMFVVIILILKEFVSRSSILSATKISPFVHWHIDHLIHLSKLHIIHLYFAVCWEIYI